MKVDQEMFINVSAGSTRIALTKGGSLIELHIERPDFQRMVGNIYKGMIQNVIPGMQAAFIDIGQDINAFLPFSEIENLDNLKKLSFDDDDDNHDDAKKNVTNQHFNPSKNLKIGDEILVGSHRSI
jgi:ribonuclease G